MVELDTGATTIVTNERVALDDVVMISPADATTSLDATIPHVADGSVTKGQFAITHDAGAAGRKVYFLATRRDGA